MNWQLVPYILPLVLSTVIALALSIVLWRNRSATGALSFFWLALLTAEWSLTYALELFTPDLGGKIFWAKMQYWGISFIATAWFVFIFQYVGNHQPLSRNSKFALAIIPSITVLLTFAEEWHPLMRSNLAVDTQGPIPVLTKQYGGWFWIQTAYSYLLIAVSIGLLLREYLRNARVYRRQIIILLVGVLIPVGGNLIYLLGWNPIHKYDWTPVAFALSGALIFLGMFRYRLFHLVPTARTTAFSSMQDGVIVLDKQSRIVDANPAAYAILNSRAADAIGKPIEQLLPLLADLLRQNPASPTDPIEMTLPQDGTWRVFRVSLTSLYEQALAFKPPPDESIGRLVTMHEITQLKQIENSLREQQANLQATLNALPDLMFEVDRDGRIYDFRAPHPDLLYSLPQEFLGKTMNEVLPTFAAKVISSALAEAAETGYHFGGIYSLAVPRGLGWFELSIAAKGALHQPGTRFIVLVRDITDRMQTEQSLDEHESSYQALFNSVSEAIYIQDPEGNFLDVNDGAVKMYGYPREFLIGKTPAIVSAPGKNDLAAVANRVKRAFAGEPQQFEFWGKRSNGDVFPKDVRLYPGTYFGKRVVIAIAFDVTERNKTEQALALHVAEMTALYETSLAINSQHDVATLLHLIVKRATDLVGARMGSIYLIKADGQTLELVVSYNLPGSHLGTQIRVGEGVAGRVAQSGEPLSIEDHRTWEGRAPVYDQTPFRRVLGVPLKVHGTVLGVIDVTDDEKTGLFSEDEIRLVSLFADQAAIALENARLFETAQNELEERTRTEAELRRLKDLNEGIVQNASEGIVLENTQGILTFVNPATANLLGYSIDELVGKHWSTIIAPEQHPIVQAANDRRARGMTDRYEIDLIHKNAQRVPVLVSGNPQYDIVTGEYVGSCAIFTDITERKNSEQEIRLHLQRLDALRAIDAAISNSLDVRVTLNVLLDQVVSKMRIDAADVLLFNPMSQALEYTVGRGLGASTWRDMHVRLGEFPAGVAALEHRPLSIANLTESIQTFPRAKALSDEGFHFYHVVPFIAKGQVKGVLEVFRRDASTPPDAEWSKFMDMLCSQAAIAIDNMALFERLQRTNTELSLAYDVTLEGWSNTLELREQETKGHANRVTQITVNLARACGVRDEDIAHIRRGALLHDIGIMGVPDSILLKPGPLDEEEWRIVKQHTVYAYKLLSSIFFLRPALDIPYCHHERWDGSGYPRGLRGEEIPLAARIFAVVDSWDALLSDRPYRDAWTETRVRAYLREKAGIYFDPHIVETFLAMAPL